MFVDGEEEKEGEGCLVGMEGGEMEMGAVNGDAVEVNMGKKLTQLLK